MNRSLIITIAGSILFFILVALLIYFLAFYEKVPVNRLAVKFCECSTSASTAKTTYSKEDFEYASDLNACFAQDFKTHTTGLSDQEKEYYIEKIKLEVVERCPDALNNVFK